MKIWPKISIVTPCFNSAGFIEETILSVVSQNYPNLEYIIIDGGSTDGTVEIIKKYEHHLAQFVTEPDLGQADAINKGIQYCSGEIFNWLNADDYLAEGALFKIKEQWDKNIDLLAGSVVNFLGSALFLFRQKNLSYENILLSHKNSQFHQPGIWVKLETLKKYLPFKTEYHYCFDSELFMRLLKDKPSIKYLNKELVFFRLHDNSKTYGSPSKMIEEFNIIRSIFLRRDKQCENGFHKAINRKTLNKILSFLTQKKINPKNKINFLLLLLVKRYFLLNRFYLSMLKRSIFR